MKNRITYGQLERVLADLSFSKRVVRGKGVVYEHPSTDTVLIVSIHRATDRVPDFVLASIRLQLSAKRRVSAADFDEMLQAIAA